MKPVKDNIADPHNDWRSLANYDPRLACATYAHLMEHIVTPVRNTVWDLTWDLAWETMAELKED